METILGSDVLITDTPTCFFPSERTEALNARLTMQSTVLKGMRNASEVIYA
jgi:hypothetical protein